jgi:hypothetical protein
LCLLGTHANFLLGVVNEIEGAFFDILFHDVFLLLQLNALTLELFESLKTPTTARSLLFSMHLSTIDTYSIHFHSTFACPQFQISDFHDAITFTFTRSVNTHVL